MEDMASEYRILIRDLVPGHEQPEGKEYPNFFSSVTGDIVTIGEHCEPEHWVKNMVSLVNFHEALSVLSTSLYSGLPSQIEGIQAFIIEIESHGALRRPITATLKKTSRPQSSRMAQH